MPVYKDLSLKDKIAEQLHSVRHDPDDYAVWLYVGKASESDTGSFTLSEMKQILLKSYIS